MQSFSHRPRHAGLLALALAGALGGALHAGAAESTPQFVREWGKFGIGPGEFNYPYGIEVAPNGNVYVADTVNNRIQVFNSTGEFLYMWGSTGSGPGQFQLPVALAFNAVGDVYVADFANYRVQKFTSAGQFLLSFGEGGTGDGQFGRSTSSAAGPRGIAVDSNGDVYVSDQGNYRVQKFSGSGQFLTKWGSYGSGAGQFSQISGITADTAGNVYVTDEENNHTQEFTSYGIYRVTLQHEFNERPRDAALLPDGQLAVLVGACGIDVFAPLGTFVSNWGACGDSLGQLYGPFGMSVDPKGNYFVADTYAHRIEVFHDDSVPVRATSWGAIKAIYR